ncbi:hypothetical protein [Clostridium magnum]|uniref:Uncharacterized protein n=1 Tax=Clostridium magnum DSM 2767 TaxID=1121326 RepID=A0A161X5U4_9CLOT|nr:hypothetical protein [Clostridium magnum]KZL89346.1 hypothetical protein CLMAG_52500 [Clostridium magnum DSM 2767]SHJ09742.1 hypothetical protein SAMN02745944_05358 [Clostridium magnum DSM 2767]
MAYTRLFSCNSWINGSKLSFWKIYQIIIRVIFVIGLMIDAVGYLPLIYGNSLIIFTVASTIVGIGFGFIMTAILVMYKLW